MKGQAVGFARYARAVGPWLRSPRTPADCVSSLRRQLANREGAFLHTLQIGIYGNPRSPFKALLRHAGAEHGDVAALVEQEGLEGALARLHEDGVRLSIEEAKGMEPVVRGSLRLEVAPGDFDNPFVPKVYEARSGGSRSAGTRAAVDLATIANMAAYQHLFREAFDLSGRPIAIWYPVPPGIAGLNNVLTNHKVGATPERWFSQTRMRWGAPFTRSAIFTAFTVAASRLARRPIPRPVYTPPSEARTVAAWLAEKRESGSPAALHATPSSAVRVCLAAERNGLDISGTFFRCGGEPYTPGKAAVVKAAGCRGACNYYMAEAGGQLGIACAEPAEPGDVHVVTDRVALIQREREMEGGGTVGLLLFTTLLPTSTKLVLNLETDDYGVVEERDCGCPAGQVGHRVHVHTIRNYSKLTSEGMTFLGSTLITLIEEVLPQRFGGAATDYQFVEAEDTEGLSRVSIVVSPAVGPVDEAAVADAAIEYLESQGTGGAMMAGVWRDSGTLRVERREPYMTRASKITPLHVG